MAKRKRTAPAAPAPPSAPSIPAASAAPSNPPAAKHALLQPVPSAAPAAKHALLQPVPSPAAPAAPAAPTTLQLIIGSYEKTLHGFLVSIPPSSVSSEDKDGVLLPATFADTFLFTAHTSPLCTLTVSPPTPQTSKRILATASSDERINLYNLSSTLPSGTAKKLTTPSQKPGIGSLSGGSKNKHLGSLHHHLNTPTALLFTPNRHKLISAGADGQIHILRTRDWSLLSTLKAPKPKAKSTNYAKDYADGYGPRIDTFGSEGYGGGAGGINDIALHPSQKILLSVGKGERGVRMWNLMTGRKAGVFMFNREDVPLRLGSEAMKVEWGRDGEEYAVAFERGAVVFGMDSRPKCRITTFPVSKIHQMRYLTLPTSITRPPVDSDDICSPLHDPAEEELLALSTEDGRILFYSTTPYPDERDKETCYIDAPRLLGSLGGLSVGMPGRIKDFDILKTNNKIYVVTGGSDGIVRIWEVVSGNEAISLAPPPTLTEEGPEKKKSKPSTTAEDTTEKAKKEEKPKEEKSEDEITNEKRLTDHQIQNDILAKRQLGRLVGIYETGRRITCLGGMVMASENSANDEENEDDNEAGGSDTSSSSSEDDE